MTVKTRQKSSCKNDNPGSWIHTPYLIEKLGGGARKKWGKCENNANKMSMAATISSLVQGRRRGKKSSETNQQTKQNKNAEEESLDISAYNTHQ